MFATSERQRPWSARAVRLSSPREIVSTLPSSFAVMPVESGCVSLPFGPSARTTLPSTDTFTPSGTGMGFLPIRDMRGSLPHVGEDFPAHLLLSRGAIGDDAARGRDDGHAHPREDGGHLVVGDVHAPAGLRDAHEARDHPLVAGPVLHVDAQHVL